MLFTTKEKILAQHQNSRPICFLSFIQITTLFAMIIGFKKFPYAKRFGTTTDGLVSHLETERAVLYVFGGFDV